MSAEGDCCDSLHCTGVVACRFGKAVCTAATAGGTAPSPCQLKVLL
jgi:hypothetical protein